MLSHGKSADTAKLSAIQQLIESIISLVVGEYSPVTIRATPDYGLIMSNS